MPVQRGRIRGRRGKQQPPPPPLPNNVDNLNNNNIINLNQENNINTPGVEETAAIATRTRRRRAAAAVAAPVDANIVAAVPAPEVKVVEDKKRVVEEKREEVGEKAMDEFDSGGKSPEKGNGADDELSAPVPEKVRYIHIYIYYVVLNDF